MPPIKLKVLRERVIFVLLDAFLAYGVYLQCDTVYIMRCTFGTRVVSLFMAKTLVAHRNAHVYLCSSQFLRNLVICCKCLELWHDLWLSVDSKWRGADNCMSLVHEFFYHSMNSWNGLFGKTLIIWKLVCVLIGKLWLNTWLWKLRIKHNSITTSYNRCVHSNTWYITQSPYHSH